MPERRSDRSEPARADLCRSADFSLVRAEDGDDGLTIEGYGAVFNSVTNIDSWEGTFEEVIAPGAFRKSLRERTPKMQFDHGRHPLLGSVPLGRWNVTEEDARGLHVVGRLSNNWLIEPFRDAIRDEAVEGMSFRFSVERDEWTDKDGKKLRDDELQEIMWRGPGDRGPIRRTLKEIRVSEVGPVVWPAYADTEVGVRSRSDGSSVVVLDLANLRSGKPLEISRLAKLVAIADKARAEPDPEDAEPTDPDELDAPASGDGSGTDESDATTGATTAQTTDDESGTTDPAADAGHSTNSSDGTTPDSTTEPRSTDVSAGRHPEPRSAPPTTDPSAGEHSPAGRPASPRSRRELRLAEYRERRDRLLAIPVTDTQ